MRHSIPNWLRKSTRKVYPSVSSMSGSLPGTEGDQSFDLGQNTEEIARQATDYLVEANTALARNDLESAESNMSAARHLCTRLGARSIQVRRINDECMRIASEISRRRYNR